jgi:hypothetical protein
MSRKRFQFTLGTLMSLVTAFAVVCSYIKGIGPDGRRELESGLLELGSAIAVFVVLCLGVWLMAMLLYLPCRAALWLFGFLNRGAPNAFRTSEGPERRHDAR